MPDGPVVAVAAVEGFLRHRSPTLCVSQRGVFLDETMGWEVKALRNLGL